MSNNVDSFIEFGEIAEFRNGLNFSKDSHGAGCKIIGVADFQKNFTPNYDSLEELNPEGITKEDDYLKKGDILFVRSNGNKALVGRSLYIDRDVRALFSGFCIRARLTSDIIDPLFLAYYTRTDHFKSSISSVAGTNINNLNQDILGNVKLPQYSKITQQKIAAVLTALDAKIELNARINAELESMAKTLYDYWFVQFAPLSFGHPPKYDMETLGNTESQPVVFGGTEGGRKMVWNEELKREIPLGWEVAELGGFVDIFDSKRIPLSSSQRAKMQGQYPYYGATSIMDYVNDYIFDGEYLLIAEDGSVMGDDGLAIVQYIWGKTWVNNHAHVLLPKDPSNKDYLYFLLKSISVVQIMTGSIQKKITQDNLLGVKFALPDKETLKLFSEFARPIRQRMINIFEESQTLTELRDWLLPMLMNGQIKVG